MDQQVSVPGPSGEYDPLAGLNDGFLGTGYSSTVEASFIAMALILAYVGYAAAKYFLSESELGRSVAEAVGLREI